MRWRLAGGLILGAGLVAYVWFRPPPPLVAPEDQIAQLSSRFEWNRDEAWFGGFSGLELSADGGTFHAITDKGDLVQGTIRRDAGVISDVNISSRHILQNPGGGPLLGNLKDSEGLALRPDGAFFVSFELLHRVFFYASADGPSKWARHHDDFNSMIKNGSLEALAIDDRNRVYTMPESLLDDGPMTPVYRLDDTAWTQPFTIARSRGFLPVGADFGPDGKLYLLERGVYPFGFRTRVRVLTLEDDIVTSDLTLLETPLGQHGNLEGLAVWRGTDGRIRLTMVADDNFMFFQDTEIVEYIVTQ